MPFVVTKKAWAQSFKDRTDAVLLRPKHAGIEWTNGSLRDALANVGLDFTSEEMEEVVKDLIDRGIVEEVKEVLPEPAPAVEPIA